VLTINGLSLVLDLVANELARSQDIYREVQGDTMLG